MKLFMRRLVLFGLLTLSSPLSAVLFAPLSIEQLAEKSQLILHGRVLSKSCQRDGAGRIYTRAELQVSEVWKGQVAANSFVIVHGGGVLGRERVTVSGQVDYQVGEEVVAFLVINPRGEGVSLGLAQGKFHVWQDRASGKKFAASLFHGAPPDPLPASRLQAQSSGSNERLTVEQLKQRVHGGVE